MHLVEQYLKDIREIRSTGGAVPETSYYSAFDTLLNEIGKKLKPKVRAVSQLTDSGAGFRILAYTRPGNVREM